MIVETAPDFPLIENIFSYYLWKELKDKTLSKISGKYCKDIFHWPHF